MLLIAGLTPTRTGSCPDHPALRSRAWHLKTQRAHLSFLPNSCMSTLFGLLYVWFAMFRSRDEANARKQCLHWWYPRDQLRLDFTGGKRSSRIFVPFQLSLENREKIDQPDTKARSERPGTSGIGSSIGPRIGGRCHTSTHCMADRPSYACAKYQSRDLRE